MVTQYSGFLRKAREFPELMKKIPKVYIPEQPTFEQLSEQNFLDYGYAAIEVTEIAIKHFDEYGKITRDGLVPSVLIRKAWEHFLKNNCGVLWKINVVGIGDNGVTIIQPDAWEHLLGWLKVEVELRRANGDPQIISK